MQDEIVTVKNAAQKLSRWFVSGLPTGELDKTFGQRNYASQDPETGEPYEPTPGNVEIARRDVLFVKTASEFEGWILACIEDEILVPRSNASRGYAPGFARLGCDALVSLCEAQGALANRYNVRFPQPASANGTVPAEHDELVATEKAAPPVTETEKTPKAVLKAALKAEVWRLADEIAPGKRNDGQGNVSAHTIAPAVATALGKNPKWHGTQGPRADGSIRNILKGWRYTPPNTGTNGTE